MPVKSNLRSYIQKESFCKAVVEDGSDIIFIVHYDGTILYHNPAVHHVMGYPVNSLVNESFFDYLDSEIVESFRIKFNECLKFPYSKNIEFRFRKADQTYQYLEFNAINLKHKEGLKGLILDCRDITQLKEDAEELFRAKLAKEQFLANMSHEIRTPLNGIAGMVNLLSDTNPTEEQQKYLTAIKNSTDNLKVIINDILDLSALESGKLKFEKIGFRISNILPQVIEMFLPQAKEKGIELNYDFVPGSEVVLLGDSVRLSQILINLISNAIKFTYEGMISVNVKISKKTNKTAYVQIDVKDTGIGIPDEKLEFIFDTFTQADESVTRKFGGTGLGLSIVKQLIDLQNGSIDVTSAENIGSTFSFTIPYKVGTETDLIIDTRTGNNLKRLNTLPGMKVLLVEDNDINRMYAANIIKNWQCKVTEAENGLICLEKHKKHDYDIILLDIQMPVMDGFETTISIRKSFKSPKSEIPIIALTANAIKGDSEKCIEIGMNDYLSKPFLPEELFRILTKYYTPRKISGMDKEKVPVQKKSAEKMAKSAKNRHTDLSYLESISNNDAKFVKEMISTFIETTPDIIDQMKIAIKKSNFKSLGLLAHKIKPSLTFMGIHSMKETAREIEVLSKENKEPLRVKELTDIFITEIQASITDLRVKLKEYS